MGPVACSWDAGRWDRDGPRMCVPTETEGTRKRKNMLLVASVPGATPVWSRLGSVCALPIPVNFICDIRIISFGFLATNAQEFLLTGKLRL